MKVKVSEASGLVLDLLVCKCTGLLDAYPRVEKQFAKLHASNTSKPIFPSTNWAQGGPIIQRENIATSPLPYDLWRAYIPEGTRVLHGREMFNWKHKGSGPTPLIAAMRCYVSSKLGDEVEIPEELK